MREGDEDEDEEDNKGKGKGTNKDEAAAAYGEDKGKGKGKSKDEGKAKGKGKTRRGGRRRHKPQEDRKLVTKDRNLRDLLLTILKLLATTTCTAKRAMAATSSTYLVPKSTSLVGHLTEELLSFTQEVNSWRDRRDAARTAGETLPPPPRAPTATLACTLLDKLADEDVGALLRDKLKAFATQLNSPEDYEEAFGICRIDGIRDDSMVRLTITIYHQEMKSAVHRALLAAKCEHKPGESPAGWMEDEVQEWIDALQGTV
jgi:hypothetical protein